MPVAKLLLTHREGRDSPLAQRLLAEGYETVHLPLLTASPAQPDDAFRREAGQGGTLILTSRAAAERLSLLEDIAERTIVAIGEGTAALARQYGATRLHLPEQATARAILDFLQAHRHQLPQPWTYLRGETVRTDLVALAASLGMPMRQRIVYRQHLQPEALQALPQGVVGCTHGVLASRTVAESLSEMLKQNDFPAMIWLAYSAAVAEPLTQGPNPPRVEVLSRPGVDGVVEWLKANAPRP